MYATVFRQISIYIYKKNALDALVRRNSQFCPSFIYTQTPYTGERLLTAGVATPPVVSL